MVDKLPIPPRRANALYAKKRPTDVSALKGETRPKTEREKAAHDMRLFGTGLIETKVDGTQRHIPLESVTIKPTGKRVRRKVNGTPMLLTLHDELLAKLDILRGDGTRQEAIRALIEKAQP